MEANVQNEDMSEQIAEEAPPPFDDKNDDTCSDVKPSENNVAVDAQEDPVPADEGSEEGIFSDNDANDGSSGEESDIEDNDENLFPSQRIRRSSNPELPETVSVLDTEGGGKVYIVGTAHFSEDSQNDVTKLIQETQPDVVVVELCHSRVNVLELDEATLLEEAKNINMTKIRAAIKQGGLVRGIMHLLLLNMSAHITKQLGMAPGGEFRTAVREAQRVPGCRVHLGDRPIQITLRRAFAELSWWQKLKLAWHMLMSKEPISKEEVEKCKQKDLLEEMLKEMTGEFPALSRVFVQERDLFLAHSLRMAARSVPLAEIETDIIPPVIVGVVGIGHVSGIVSNWNTVTPEIVQEFMRVPETSTFSKVFKWTFRATLVGILSWGCYKLFYGTYRMFA